VLFRSPMLRQGCDLEIMKHADGENPVGRSPYHAIAEMLAVLAQPEKFSYERRKRAHVLISGPSNIGKSFALTALTTGPLKAHIQGLSVKANDEKYLLCNGNAATKIFFYDEAHPEKVKTHRDALFKVMDPGASISMRGLNSSIEHKQSRGLLFFSNHPPEAFENAVEQNIATTADAYVPGKYHVDYLPDRTVPERSSSRSAWLNRVRPFSYTCALPTPFPCDARVVTSGILQAMAIAFLGYETKEAYLQAIQSTVKTEGILELMIDEDDAVDILSNSFSVARAERIRNKIVERDANRPNAASVQVGRVSGEDRPNAASVEVGSVDVDDDDDEEGWAVMREQEEEERLAMRELAAVVQSVPRSRLANMSSARADENIATNRVARVRSPDMPSGNPKPHKHRGVSSSVNPRHIRFESRV